LEASCRCLLLFVALNASSGIENASEELKVFLGNKVEEMQLYQNKRVLCKAVTAIYCLKI